MMRGVFFILFIFSSGSLLWAASFFVSPSGSTSGDGSFQKPWTLQFALNHPMAVLPGDTIWLKAGVYLNSFDSQSSFSCFTNGTDKAPIIFRNYNNERAILDGNLVYTVYAGFGNCSYTWFWGIEVRNSMSVSRNQNIGGGVTCTAENMKFINMIIYDTGHGLDVWKTAKNTEIYGNIIFHIGNNLNNNGNLEGHGHGLYLQNDTFGMKKIHNNIIFNTYGNGIKIWQTTTTAAIGNFDIQKNILFNGGAASENLGGVGNNSRTHNFFVLSNGSNNPLLNTVIKHNYTYAGTNMPRPSVNAFGLNHGVRNFILDSNYLTCQTRLGFNNTPIFDASVKGNKIMAGIPAVYGYYLWGFTQTDFPLNDYFPEKPKQGPEYFIIPNAFDPKRSHLVIYNWDSASTVNVDVSAANVSEGETFYLVNVLDCFSDTIKVVCPANKRIDVPMTGRFFIYPNASNQIPATPYPEFGVFILIKKSQKFVKNFEFIPESSQIRVIPNPTSGKIEINKLQNALALVLENNSGVPILSYSNIADQLTIDLSPYPKGLYLLRIIYKHKTINKWVLLL